ncbi:MAG TPA: LysM peptidoglycan-binding domain-containing protein [Cyclobacteriaceae bacterium]|jgi:membrane-bound lytic murein transglycosylase D|nr:LysM peptidoglycan-binding domain-containing protein [Cyclobacteriaceae bacterium]
MRFFAVALIFFGVAVSYAQTPEVPHKIHFAGMVLTIRDDAKREIQKDVDALTKHKRYFDMNVERARTYFPVIEKIFKEEQLPEDFKYLALQESALTPDAVSVSNAVGFWQFKDYTAQEMGMRVDNQIDERMNIVSATYGAARYIKQNNWRFNNWVLALQAYQMGAGGVERALGDKYNGDRHMEINSETYWYVKKYLAHKVAFEEACQGHPKVKISLYETKSEKKLSEIATEVSVDENVLGEYNKWAKRGTIPSDKPYFLVIPGGSTLQDFNSLTLSSEKASKATPLSKGNHNTNTKTVINGVEAIKAHDGETLSIIASRAGLDVSKFIQYNDLSIDHSIRSGSFYFVKQKKKKNPSGTYRTKMGDDLWSVSQQFGIKLKSLKKLNPGIKEEGFLASGSMIALISVKNTPNQAVLTVPGEVAELSDDTFSWGAQPALAAIPSSKGPETPRIAKIDTVNQIKSQMTGLDSVVMHEVQQGETLYSIANKYSVDVSDLIKRNQLNVTTPLKKGQLISVHKVLPSVIAHNDLEVLNQPEMFTYEVKSSDTLYGIARQFGATIKEIMDWNNKSVLTVTTGEKLKILKR